MGNLISSHVHYKGQQQLNKISIYLKRDVGSTEKISNIKT